MINKWQVMFSINKAPEFIMAAGTHDLEAQVRALAPKRELLFDYFTDQVNILAKRKSTDRLDKFMVLMAA